MKSPIEIIFNLTAAAIIIYLFIRIMTSGIISSIDNQDIMLCNSAIKSGNEEYLKKCECYYISHDIKCLQEIPLDNHITKGLK